MSWAFFQLRTFVAYKARAAGVRVVYVDPRNTSRTCSACGYCDKRNRPDQAHFRCLQCSYTATADYNAALNIAARAAVNRPIVLPPSGLRTAIASTSRLL
jgi:putative transposase